MQWHSSIEHKFDPKAPIIIVAPTFIGIDGRRKKANMALDTGSSYTMIPWSMAETLGYEPSSSRRRIGIITASGVEEAPVITVNSVSALGKEARNVDCAVHDLPEASRVDGLLGLSFFRNFEICLDFRKGIIEID